MKFGFVGPSYSSQSVNADCQSCINLYVERIESGDGNSVAALYPTPGLMQFVDLVGNSVRGEITINGRTFAVCDNKFQEMTIIGMAGSVTLWGIVANDSQPVSMVASNLQILVASGGNAYVFDLMANTLTLLSGTLFSGVQVIKVEYSQGFFIALRADSVWQISALTDATSWDPLQFAEVSVFPDEVLTMLVVNNQPWFWSNTKAVPYYLSGGSAISTFPFDVVQGVMIEQGVSAINSPCLLDNTVFWLGSDTRGKAIVWRAAGYSPQRVSNHAIEFAIQGYSRIDDAIAYAYQDQGHLFYQLYFPTANKTWDYDVATGMWHERGYWDEVTASYTAHRSRCHTYNATFDKHLVGDWKSGIVYEMKIPFYQGGQWQFATGNGNPIRRLRRAPHISNEQQWMFHSQIQIYLETGLGPIPPLTGNEAPTLYTFAASDNSLWQMGCDDSGILFTQAGGSTAGTLILTDIVGGTTSWRVVVDTLGILGTVPVPFNAIYPQNAKLVSSSGSQRYLVEVDDNGILATEFLETISRAPQIVISWSNDGGHSFRSDHIVNAGKSGEYQARAIMRRLGRARDRVYQVEWSDPVPFRIVDAYLSVAGAS